MRSRDAQRSVNADVFYEDVAMWLELIQRIMPECESAPRASVAQLTSVEQKLGVELPDDLRSLLLETNGVQGQHGIDLIWSLERIETDNLAFRANPDFPELYMPFDPLLFFADAGNGDQFAFPILAGQIRRPDVFVWNHELDSRTWIAPSLQRYLEWWLSGQIKL